MIAGCLLAWTGVALAGDGAVRFDRLELLSEASPGWLADELPRFGSAPGVVSLRYIEQLAVVGAVGRNVDVGIGLDADWIGVHGAFGSRRTLLVDGAVITHALLPAGARVGLAWRPGRLRIGVSAVALSYATWTRPSYASWGLTPAVGVGVGRIVARRAPWMD